MLAEIVEGIIDSRGIALGIWIGTLDETLNHRLCKACAWGF